MHVAMDASCYQWPPSPVQHARHTVAAAARATYLPLRGCIGVKDKMKTLRGRRHRRRERAIMMSARHRAAAAATAGRPKVKRNA